MKLLAFFFVFAVPMISFSQKIITDKVDDFSNKRRITTSTIKFKGIENSLYGSASVHDRDTSMLLIIYYRPGIATYSNEKSTGLFKLDNGDIITLENSGSFETVTGNDFGSVMFYLDPATREIFKKHKVVKYKIETHDSNIEMDLKEKFQTAFGDVVNLLETTMRAGNH